ncbi:GGDEF domain-containing protein [Hydrogenovibrio marinus]|uniref:diguanylate cyclase n=1 Tax=Hydrogenovibrio marinus TaxID=28885 RepID=A0A066ZS59_HYDMR|nr:GGDEF domain-containing protein [Hydrogenovibrio marinus]KDN96327.1 hypothetical protein EI16_08615 [Hydrogenovibrio marinus]BBN60480.1 hypothetical protein HVMH_2074 [Hydrogenovibrio marinus]
MLETDFHTYIYALHAVLITSTASILLVIFSLQNRELPVASIRLFKLFFLFAIISWTLLAARDLYGPTHKFLPPGTGYIISSFLLLIAVKQCSDDLKKIAFIAGLHIIPIYAIFHAEGAFQHILVGSIYALFVYPIIFYASLKRAIKLKNIGSGLIALSALVIVITAPIQLYLAYEFNSLRTAYTIAFTATTTSFILVSIGFLTSILIHDHRQLLDLALNDPLTGVLNRRGLTKALPIILSTTEVQQTLLNVISVDIDYFKQVNDSYGHKVGDAVLIEVAKVLQETSRQGDLVARIGGEEFVLILPSLTLDVTKDIAERIRHKIESTPIQFPECDIQVTASFGIASASGRINFDTLLKEADKMLYQAKNNGRNCICCQENLDMA